MAGRLHNLKAWLPKEYDPELEIHLVHDFRDQETESELVAIVENLGNTNVFLHSGKYGSPGGTRNHGLKHAAGDYVCFWDAEWRVLKDTKGEFLSRCRQIVAEFHNLHQIGSEDFFKEVVASLQLLAVNHSLVNVHINNWAKYDIVQGILFPDVIEVTYIRKPIGSNTLDNGQYLTSEKNTPNNPTRSDAEISFISKVSY